MIDEGALMEAHDCHFGTPLHVACARQHLDCVKVLLRAGHFLHSRFFVFLVNALACLIYNEQYICTAFISLC